MKPHLRILLKFLLANSALIFLFYAPVYCFDYKWHTNDEKYIRLMSAMNLSFLSLFNLLYGAFRAHIFHLVGNKYYRQWLAYMPWTSDKPLPFGPVHLIKFDFLVLGIITLLAYSNHQFKFLIPLLCFFASYLAVLFITLFLFNQLGTAILFLFMAPLTIYPIFHEIAALTVLVIMYIIYYISLQMVLKKFPWNSDPWTFTPPKHYLKEALNQNTIGFPQKQLRAGLGGQAPVGRKGLIVLSFFVAALVTWWSHVGIWLYQKSVNVNIIIVGSIIIAFIRYAIYQGPYHPPISFLGRFATRQFIIPAYDKVRIAPVIILLIGIFAPSLLKGMELPHNCAIELTIFLVIFLAFALPPRFHTWQLTGAHRIRSNPHARQTQQKPDPSIQKMFEALANFKRIGP